MSVAPPSRWWPTPKPPCWPAAYLASTARAAAWCSWRRAPCSWWHPFRAWRIASWLPLPTTRAWRGCALRRRYVVGPRARGGILFGRGGSPRVHRCRRRERGVGAPRVVGTLTVRAGAISHTLVVTVRFDEGSTLLLAGRPAPTRVSGCPPGALLSFASVMPSTLSAYGAIDVLMLRGNCTGPPRRPSTPFTAMCP
jgi:hypothetical protein